MLKRQSESVRSRVLVAGVALLGLVLALPAWASLGGDTASIEADQIHLQGTRKMIAAQNYTVHEIQAPGGAVVREYVSSSGKVFAVAWHGPWPPDLHQLLGSYSEQYVQAVKAQSGTRMGRRPLIVEQPGLVVHSGGHPRAFAGMAYVPENLPQGLRAEDIQ
jgi:Protein of unknown function (DUF2844)